MTKHALAVVLACGACGSAASAQTMNAYAPSPSGVTIPLTAPAPVQTAAPGGYAASGYGTAFYAAGTNATTTTTMYQQKSVFVSDTGYAPVYATPLVYGAPPAIVAAPLPPQPIYNDMPATQPPTRDVRGRFSVLEENDYFVSHDDRHYTQGLQLSYLTTPVTPDDAFDQPFGLLHDVFGIYGGDARKRKYEWMAGQKIFTPSNTEIFAPQPNAWPYSAFLYGGASLLQDTNHGGYHTLENMEIQLGVVGPPALGQVTQNTFHEFIGDTASLGWHNQIHTEPGGILSYEKKWRFQQPLIGNFAIDAIPEAGATVGNILTYGEVGGMVRIGQNLGADYGPNRIRPNLSGTGWFDPDQLDGDFGWYIYAGSQGRVVGQDLSITGNTYQPSIGLNERNLVADFDAGASLILGNAVRADFTYTQLTHQFFGQQSHPDHFGGINLVVGF